MKTFSIFLTFVLANLAVGAVDVKDEDSEMDLSFIPNLERRLAPVPPIATDPAGATVTIISVVTPAPTVITSPASGGENPRYCPLPLFSIHSKNGIRTNTNRSSVTSQGVSSTASEPNHGSASPTGLFPITTTSSKSSASGSVASKSSSAADSKSTAAAAVPTPLPAAPGLGALAAVIVWAVAVL